MSITPIILVADRNEDAARYLREELSKTNYALLHARDGEEVLSLVDTHPSIAFAVIELELPLVNGLRLIGRLSSRDPKPAKIIATTFIKDELICELAKHMGADAIVRKPRPERTWVGTLRQLLPKPPKGFRTSPVDGRPLSVDGIPNPIEIAGASVLAASRDLHPSLCDGVSFPARDSIRPMPVPSFRRAGRGQAPVSQMGVMLGNWLG